MIRPSTVLALLALAPTSALAGEAKITISLASSMFVTVQNQSGSSNANERDLVLVTAAPEHVPQPLIEQLKPGGRLVIPVGPQRASQTLKVLEKRSDGTVRETDVLPVAFVPLTR